jgi:cyclophilin family peptidyl-prolyl cis-trans isomerase
MKFKFFTLLICSTLVFLNASCQAGEENTQDVSEQTNTEMSADDNNDENGEETTTTTSTTGETDIPASGMTNVKVKMKTSMGDVVLVLYDETPLHRDNFVKLVKEGFYEGLLFHRVIKDFMIQGGDPESKGAAAGVQLGGGGPGYTIPAEIQPGLYHKKGALCAARQGDQVNPEKRSSGSQFYVVTGKVTSKTQLTSMCENANKQQEDKLIGNCLQDPNNADFMQRYTDLQKLYQTGDPANQQKAEEDFQALLEEVRPVALKDFTAFEYTDEQIEVYETIGGTPFLDNNYTVFGEVIEGLDIIENMGVVATAPGDRPLEDVVILSMEIVE